MNQNRNQNRRRGRGGNRGQGGGNQGNRIDSRARGNAPQMLEKYKKLAHDASLNGDRVQTEYYLQFADHYFRVVADSRAQRDEQRPRHERDHEREREQSYEEGYEYEEAEEARAQQPRRERDDRDDGERASEEGERGAEGEEVAAETGDNTFAHEGRGRRERSRGRGRPANGADEPAEEAGFDAQILPPAIGRSDEEEKPRRTRTRRPRPSEDGDEQLEAVS